MAYGLMFRDPQLEGQFRRLVQGTEEEVGGYLLVRADHASVPRTRPFRHRDLWRELPETYRHHFRIIEAVVVVPNDADEKETHWSCWDMDKVKYLAEASAHMHRASPIHFHTHPSGSCAPSNQDLIFAARNCEQWAGYAEFVVVTPRPLRLHPYKLEYSSTPRVHEPGREGLECGPFVSWSDRRLRRVLGLTAGKAVPPAQDVPAQEQP